MSATELTHVSEPAEPGADAGEKASPAQKPPRGPQWMPNWVRRRLSGGWTARRIAATLAPAMIYLGIRELGLLVLTWMSATHRIPMVAALSSWDGLWFLSIADGGYDDVPPSLVDARGLRTGETPLAFFPGYPFAVRLLAGIDGPGGIGVLTAGFTVTIVSGVICAYGLARLGSRIGDGSSRVGLTLVALFAASPMAIVLSMAYSEAMFCAFAIWALVGVLERKWVLAGVCCGLAGVVRPTAAALVLAVGLAALVAVITRRDRWRPWVAGALAPVGLIGYLAWVGVQTGHWNGWFELQQRGWDSGFDGGAATWRFTMDVLAGNTTREVFEYATVGLVLVGVVLAVLTFTRRLEWPLLVYGTGVLVMDLASNGLMYSKVRLLVPAFTLLIPVAVGLARRRTTTLVLVLCGLAVASAWFGAYAITAWGYAI